MLQNFLKIALRNLSKHKGFSFINIFGLSIGLASCIILFTFVLFHYSFDKFHNNYERIFKLAAEGEISGREYSIARVPFVTADMLKERFPQIESVTRVCKDKFNTFSYGENKFYEKKFLFADNSFLDIFSFTLLKGDKKRALLKPDSVVLTKSLAQKYFGDSEPLGKVLMYENKYPLKVTGILAQTPENSQLQFNMLVSTGTYKVFRKRIVEAKIFSDSHTYIKLRKSADTEQFRRDIKDFLIKSIPQYASNDSRKLHCHILPLESIHFEKKFRDGLPGRADKRYIMGLATLAVLILIVACMNYINLVTARSSVRNREVGIRKTFGAFRSSVIKQFILEAGIFGLFSLGLSTLINTSFSSEISGLLSFNISDHYFSSPLMWIGVAVLIVFIALFAGGFPAYMISKTQPLEIFRKSLKPGGIKLRSMLVIFQFVILTTLIILTFGVSKQLKFFNSGSLGIDIEKLAYYKFLYMYDAESLVPRLFSMKEEMKKIPGVKEASICSQLPGVRVRRSRYNINGSTTVFHSVDNIQADNDLLNTLGIKLSEGSNFSKDHRKNDLYEIIINRAAVKKLGLQNPVGKVIYMVWNNKAFKRQIVGIVEDFHLRSLHHRIAPLVIQKSNAGGLLAVKLKTDDLQATLMEIKKTIGRFFPDNPAAVNFLDDTFMQLYSSEKRFGEIISTFTIIAILIGCLGILGLTIFTAERRIKEIGIKKVIGASIFDITSLLIKDIYLKLGVAIAIAIPVGYYFLGEWLMNFAYKTEMGSGIYLAAALSILIITSATIVWNVLKIARVNPVEVLKNE